MTDRHARLGSVQLPDIGAPLEPRPELPAAVFAARLGRVRQRMAERGLDALVVYGDREHVGNIQYLTNYDPRFEETVLVVRPAGTPVLVVGNEGMGYSNIARLEVERRLYQPFSLLGQPRNRSAALEQVLRDAGLKDCRRVGTAGWKYFADSEFDNADTVLELPEFVAVSIRRAAGPAAHVVNATALFMDPGCGLRNLNEPEQLADFEWVSTHNSNALLTGLRAVAPGRTETEVFAAIPHLGLPFSCYSSCATGERVRRYGFPSPSGSRIALGDPLFLSYSYQGANCCRFGWVVRGATELPSDARDYVERAALPYFAALAAWYEALDDGTPGAALHRAVVARLEPLGFRFALNIGHQIAVDEWTHSPIAADSATRLASGMYVQADFFPSLPAPYLGAFAEDGVALADAALRAELATRYPAMWARIDQRRRFMREQLGVNLPAAALPFSNLAGALLPYLLDLSLACVLE